MQILGVDYGRSKIGLALGDTVSKLAQPWRVLKYESLEETYVKIKEIVSSEGVEKIVVGVSEGEMGKESKAFGKKLESELATTVVFQDETLTSHDAQTFSIQAGIQRKKRKGMEDAYAASLLLQSYFDLL